MSEKATMDQARPRRSRDRLLAALGEVFEAKGYDGATLTELAAATGLGKASLYHHFPGGKAEMAATLLRDAVTALERDAFARLAGPGAAVARLASFVDGFQDYAQGGERSCLVTVLGRAGSAEIHGETVAAQYADWQRRLAAVFEETGLKPKRADRAAEELLSSLYGSLLMARLRSDPKVFRRQVKRLKKWLAG